MPRHPCSQGLLDRIASALRCILLVLAEGGHFGKVGAGDEQRLVVVGFDDERIIHSALLQAEILLDLAHQPAPQLPVAAVHWQLGPAVATNHGEVTATAFMALETTALPRQPPPEFASRHAANIVSPASQA